MDEKINQKYGLIIVFYNDHWSIGKVKYILQFPELGGKNILKNKDYRQYRTEYEKDLPTYGLGTKRTLDAYWSFTGIDLENKISKSRLKYCGFEEDEES